MRYFSDSFLFSLTFCSFLPPGRRQRVALAAFVALMAVSGPVPAQPADTPPAPADAVAPGAGAAPENEAPDAESAPAAEAKAGEAAVPAGSTPPAAAGDESAVPTNLRLRRLEQQVQALKERAWRAKARVGMLKEAVLGGGVGARASIGHVNKMGNSYRLIKLVYALDGTQIFARNDPSGALHEEKNLDVLTGPIAPGSHTISVLAVYRGNGYGVFKYLNKYRFTVRSSHTFTASEGKGTSIKVVAFEKGGVTTPLEQRPSFDFKVNALKEK